MKKGRFHGRSLLEIAGAKRNQPQFIAEGHGRTA